jgi:hypothetical chaperone protein
MSVEEAKIALTTSGTAACRLDAVEEGLAVAISTADLAAAISHDLQSILAGIAETVRMAGLRFDQIDKVFTTGGSTAIPMMKTWIEASFPHAETVEGDRFWERREGACAGRATTVRVSAPDAGRDPGYKR